MKKDLVWYCSYGSNILENRFHCYIEGGKPKGSNTNYDGCSDKNLPTESEETYIASEIYFAKKSRTWNNGGVAFIKNNFDETQTLAKMYLITARQFLEVVQQENNLKTLPKVDFVSLIQMGSTIIPDIKWYNKIIYLGQQNDYPIFTITHGDDDFAEVNKPDSAYLKIIIEGLKENFNFNENDVVGYLENKKGIIGNYSREEIIRIALSIH